MRILIINSVCGIRSTGRIAADIAEEYMQRGWEAVLAYGREEAPEKWRGIAHRITGRIGNRIAGVKARLFDNEGFNSRRETRRFLKWADEWRPDVLWLHNLHGYYINIELLFRWIKSRPDMEVKWTLHDCWAFTGHCSHFTYVHCYKWEAAPEGGEGRQDGECSAFGQDARLNTASQNGGNLAEIRSTLGCRNCGAAPEGDGRSAEGRSAPGWQEGETLGCRKCPQKGEYPASFLLDRSRRNYARKAALFTGVRRMTIITPSRWLGDLVKRSFLREYPVEVRHNTIDTASFKPTPSGFRAGYGLEDKKIVLGVASAWGPRKGLQDFVKLSGMLSPDRYKIVLVGLTEKEVRTLPDVDFVPHLKDGGADAAAPCASSAQSEYAELAESVTTSPSRERSAQTIRLQKGRILAIGRTDSKTELAEIYTAADVFVNPSREETFGLTTLEAVCCGTHAIVYKDTACEEVALELGKDRASVVPNGDVDALAARIVEVCI